MIGFVTSDGLFFVEVGAPNFIGLFTAYYNGSQIYTYEIELNITSLSSLPETATIHLIDVDNHVPLANLTVPVGAFSSQLVQVPMPTEHSWTQVRVAVDGTPGYFFWETPYTFLSLGNLYNGGIDLAVFIGFGIYLWIAYPISVKAERMTKRAVYAPEWKAAWWLHGLVIGELAGYVSAFQQINSFFKGWEILLIPLPEAFFVFFWTAGRHSRRILLEFEQPAMVLGRPIAYIRRKFYGGIDPEGNIILVKYKSRSIPQWWFRSRGHHVKAWILFPSNKQAPTLLSRSSVIDAQARPAPSSAKPMPLEPLTMPVYDYESLTPDQLRDPTRLPRSGTYDQFRGAAILGEGGNEDEPVSFRFPVVRVSDFRLTWPHLSWHITVKVPPQVDANGNMTEATTREKFSLFHPHIVDGSAEITLESQAYQDVIAMMSGLIEAEDLAHENNDLAVALAAARAENDLLASRKAEERFLANRSVRNRRESELTEEEQEAIVERYKAEDEKRRSRSLPGST